MTFSWVSNMLQCLGLPIGQDNFPSTLLSSKEYVSTTGKALNTCTCTNIGSLPKRFKSQKGEISAHKLCCVKTQYRKHEETISISRKEQYRLSGYKRDSLRAPCAKAMSKKHANGKYHDKKEKPP